MAVLNTSSIRTAVAIKLPFSITPQGAVEDTSDFRQIWQDRVKSVLLTSFYERANLHDFGCALYDELMNGAEGRGGATERAAAAIYDAFSKFLSPALSLEDVSVNFEPADGVLEITVTYKLPDNTTISTTINSLSISGSNPPEVTTQANVQGAL